MAKPALSPETRTTRLAEWAASRLSLQLAFQILVEGHADLQADQGYALGRADWSSVPATLSLTMPAPASMVSLEMRFGGIPFRDGRRDATLRPDR